LAPTYVTAPPNASSGAATNPDIPELMARVYGYQWAGISN